MAVVSTATGIGSSELSGLRCSDVDLWQREITVCGKGGKDRIVRSATRLPGAWTGTSAPVPGTPRPGGRSCGSELATGSR